jgi:hypothetical protein
MLDIPATALFEIDIPTDNELDIRFLRDLGVTLQPLQTDVTLDCDGPLGFAGVTQKLLACNFAIVTGSASILRPVIIKMNGMSTLLVKDVSNTLRIVKFRNPAQNAAIILSTALMTHIKIRVWNNNEVNRYLLYQDIDYRVFNNVNFYTNVPTDRTATITTTATKTYEALSGSPGITYSIARTTGSPTDL